MASNTRRGKNMMTKVTKVALFVLLFAFVFAIAFSATSNGVANAFTNSGTSSTISAGNSGDTINPSTPYSCEIDSTSDWSYTVPSAFVGYGEPKNIEYPNTYKYEQQVIGTNAAIQGSSRGYLRNNGDMTSCTNFTNTVGGTKSFPLVGIHMSSGFDDCPDSGSFTITMDKTIVVPQEAKEFYLSTYLLACTDGYSKNFNHYVKISASLLNGNTAVANLADSSGNTVCDVTHNKNTAKITDGTYYATITNNATTTTAYTLRITIVCEKDDGSFYNDFQDALALVGNLVAKVTQGTRNILYDSNYPDAATSMADVEYTQTFLYAAGQTLTSFATLVSSHGFSTIDGWECIGWSTSETATTAAFADKTSSDNIGGALLGNTVRIYAVWKQKFQVNYYNSSTATNYISKYYDEGIAITLNDIVSTEQGLDYFANSGYYLNGWKNKANETVISSIPASSVVAGTVMSVYATWDGISATITYNANGGTNSNPTQIVKWAGQNIAINNTCIKDDAFLINWQSSSNSEYVTNITASVLSAAQSNIQSSSVALTLTAHWYATIDFGRDKNGYGEWGSETNPYLIRTQQQLKSLSGIVNGTQNASDSIKYSTYASFTNPKAAQSDKSYAGCVFKLMNDVTLSGLSLSATVVDMTGTPKSTAACDIAGNGSEVFGNLFDNNTGTKYCASGRFTLTFDYGSSVYVSGYSWWSGNDTNKYPTRNFEYCQISGSNDNVNWSVINTVSGAGSYTTSNGTETSFTAQYPGVYRYFKIYAYAASDGTYQMSEFKLHTSTGTDFAPVGATASTPFAASFDGNGKTVSGLQNFNGSDYTGLFGYAAGTSSAHTYIKNITVAGAVLGGNYTAGVVGHANYVDLSGVTNNVNVTANGVQVGGVAGHIANSSISGTIINNGTVVGNRSATDSYVGGLFGAGDTITVSATLTNKANVYGGGIVGGIFGTPGGFGIGGGALIVPAGSYTWTNAKNGSTKYVVSGTGWLVGGLVGITGSGGYNAAVLKNENDVTSTGNSTGGIFGYGASVTGAVNSGNVTGNGGVGGIAGRSGSFVSCTNTGNVTSLVNTYTQGAETYSLVGAMVGGIVGHTEGYIYNCTNSGTITGGTSGGYFDYVGGIAGMLKSEGTVYGILGNTNSGTIAGGSYVGGILGYSKYATIGSRSAVNTTNSGTVSASGSFVGGIVGYTYLNSLENATNTASVSGLSYVGGIGGQMQDVTYVGAIVNGASGTSSKITASGTGSERVGGIAGMVFGAGASTGNFVNYMAVSGVTYVGGITGYHDWGNLVASVNNGAVNGTTSVGGIIGYESGSGTVAGTQMNNATVTGTTKVGGFVGEVANLSFNGGSNATTYNNGVVTGNGAYVGGIVGVVTGSLTLSNVSNRVTVKNNASANGTAGLVGGAGSAATVSISNCYNSAAVNAGTASGSNGSAGILGHTPSDAGAITIANCYNTGIVTAYQNVGGIAGRLGSNGAISVTHCYNTVGVTGNNTVGGIIGYLSQNSGTASTVQYCYNGGTVTSTANAGGVIGNTGGTGINVVYCFNTGSASNVATSSGLVGGTNNANVSFRNAMTFYVGAVPSNHLTTFNAGNAGYYVAYLSGSTLTPLQNGADVSAWTNILSSSVTIDGFRINSASVSGGHYYSITDGTGSYPATGTITSLTTSVATLAWDMNQTVTATLVGNYNSTNMADCISIVQGTFAINTLTNVYDGATHAATLTYTSPDSLTPSAFRQFVNYYNYADCNGTVLEQHTLGTTVPVNAGTYGALAYIRQSSQVTSPILGVTSNNSASKITKRAIGISKTDNLTPVYDKTEYSAYVTLSNIVASDRANMTFTASGYTSRDLPTTSGNTDKIIYKVAKTAMGTYKVSVTAFTGNSTALNNYSFVASNNTATLTISAHPLTNADITALFNFAGGGVSNQTSKMTIGSTTYALLGKGAWTDAVIFYSTDAAFGANGFAFNYVNENNTSVTELLVKDTDFTVGTVDKTKLTPTKTTITGKGNYSGSVDVYYVFMNGDFSGNSTASNWGSAANPYRITSAAELVRLYEISNGAAAWNSLSEQNSNAVCTNNTYANGYFVVDNDLDMTAAPWSRFFSTIGGDDSHVFSASFDGLNHTITYSVNNDTAAKGNYAGLFGYISRNQGTVTINNLTVEGSATSAYDYVGGVAGYATGTAIRFNNCTSRVVVSGRNYVGGIVGAVENLATIGKVSFAGTVSATGVYVGGIAGLLNGARMYASHPTSQTAPQTYDTVELGDALVAGQNYRYNFGGADYYFLATIDAVLSEIGVNYSVGAAQLSMTGTVSGTNYVGGIAGAYIATENALVKMQFGTNGSQINGTVNATTTSDGRVGGLFGYIEGLGSTTTTTSVNKIASSNFVELNPANAVVILHVSGSGSYIGGLVGYSVGTAIINNSNDNYWALSATSTISVSGNYVGGAVGRMAVYKQSETVKTADTFRSSTIIGAYRNSIAIVGGNYVGGILGFAKYGVGNFDDTTAITRGANNSSYYLGASDNSSSTGLRLSGDQGASVTGSGNYVGGLIGSIGTRGALATLVTAQGTKSEAQLSTSIIDDSTEVVVGSGVTNGARYRYTLADTTYYFAANATGSVASLAGSAVTITDTSSGSHSVTATTTMYNAPTAIGVGGAVASGKNYYITIDGTTYYFKSGINGNLSSVEGETSNRFNIHVYATCVNDSNVSGASYVGGVIGSIGMFGDTATNSGALVMLNNGSRNGVQTANADGGNMTNIVGTGNYVGGIAGYLGNNTSNRLYMVVNTARVGASGANYVGGIVGYMIAGVGVDGGYSVSHSVSTYPDGVTASTDMYLGADRVGGIVGGLGAGAFIGYNYSMGFVLSKVTTTKGGVVGLATQSQSIYDSWTVYTASNPTYSTVVGNDNGNYILADTSLVTLPSLADLAGSAGITGVTSATTASHNAFPVKVDYLSIALTVPSNSTNYAVFYASGDARTSSANRYASQNLDDSDYNGSMYEPNNVLYLRVKTMSADSFKICKESISFANLAYDTNTYASLSDADKQQIWIDAFDDGRLSDEYEIEFAAAPTLSNGVFSGACTVKYVNRITGVSWVVGDVEFTVTTGDSSLPYTISNTAQWNSFCAAIVAGNNYQGKWVKLLNDITVSTLAGATGWDGTQFAGTFDGNGKTITVNYTTSDGVVGLFPKAQNATFLNVTVGGSITSTGSEVGGIVGATNKGVTLTFKNCQNNANITGTHNVGGILGFANSNDDNTSLVLNIYMTDVVNTGTITASDNQSSNGGAGGIIGGIETCNVTTSSIDSARNSGNVNADANVGGIIGYNNSVAEIYNSANTGSIYGYYGIGSGTTGCDTYAGGIGGLITAKGHVNVYGSYNTGSVIAWGNKAGGILGADTAGNSSNEVTKIYYCFNSGKVQVGGPETVGGSQNYRDSENTNSSNGVQGGGIAGVGIYVDIRYCYNVGTIIGHGLAYNVLNGNQSRIGGIVGYLFMNDSTSVDGTAIKYCYNAGIVKVMNTAPSGYIYSSAGIVGAGRYDAANFVPTPGCDDIVGNCVGNYSMRGQVYSAFDLKKYGAAYLDSTAGDNWIYNGGSSSGTNNNACLPAYEMICGYDSATGAGTRPSGFGDWSSVGGTYGSAELLQSGNAALKAGTTFGYIYVPGCLPQLSIFATDTETGVAMTGQTTGFNTDTQTYELKQAGSAFSPYVIKNGVELAGLSQLMFANGNYHAINKYYAFADGTNNLDGYAMTSLDMDTWGISKSAAFTFVAYPYNSYDNPWGTYTYYNASTQTRSSTAIVRLTSSTSNGIASFGNLTKASSTAEYQNFYPIGSDQTHYFAGTLTGYVETDGTTITIMPTITNVKIRRTTQYAGLIGYGSDCTLSDIVLTNSTVTSTATNSYAGAFAGRVTGGTTLQSLSAGNGVTVTATGSVTTYAGGIVGEVAVGTSSGDRVNIIDCSSAANVSASQNNAGGIAGSVQATSNVTTISNCTVTSGTISAKSVVGGVVGYRNNAGTLIIDGCVVGTLGTLSTNAGTVKLLGQNTMGGIISAAPSNGDAITLLNACIVCGDALIQRTGTANASTEYKAAIGGFVGYTQSTTISGESYDYGYIDVSGYATENVGGLIGYMGASTSTSGVLHIYGTINAGTLASSNIGGAIGSTSATSDISGTYYVNPTMTTSGSTNVGGFIGYNGGNCYVLGTADLLDANGDAASGAGAEAVADGDALVADDSDATAQADLAIGVIEGKENVGGFIGYNGGTLFVGAQKNSSGAMSVGTFNATLISSVKGNRYVGGFVGYNGGTITTSECFCNVINTGAICTEMGAGTTEYVGGILGYNAAGATFDVANESNSLTNSGEVGTFGTSEAAASQYVGGIVGASYGTFSNVGMLSNSGKVYGFKYVGGSVGYMASGLLSGTMTNGKAYTDTNSNVVSRSIAVDYVATTTALDGASVVSAGKDVALNGSYYVLFQGVKYYFTSTLAGKVASVNGTTVTIAYNGMSTFASSTDALADATDLPLGATVVQNNNYYYVIGSTRYYFTSPVSGTVLSFNDKNVVLNGAVASQNTGRDLSQTNTDITSVNTTSALALTSGRVYRFALADGVERFFTSTIDGTVGTLEETSVTERPTLSFANTAVSGVTYVDLPTATSTVVGAYYRYTMGATTYYAQSACNYIGTPAAIYVNGDVLNVSFASLIVKSGTEVLSGTMALTSGMTITSGRRYTYLVGTMRYYFVSPVSGTVSAIAGTNVTVAPTSVIPSELVAVGDTIQSGRRYVYCFDGASGYSAFTASVDGTLKSVAETSVNIDANLNSTIFALTGASLLNIGGSVVGGKKYHYFANGTNYYFTAAYSGDVTSIIGATYDISATDFSDMIADTSTTSYSEQYNGQTTTFQVSTYGYLHAYSTAGGVVGAVEATFGRTATIAVNSKGQTVATDFVNFGTVRADAIESNAGGSLGVLSVDANGSEIGIGSDTVAANIEFFNYGTVYAASNSGGCIGILNGVKAKNLAYINMYNYSTPTFYGGDNNGGCIGLVENDVTLKNATLVNSGIVSTSESAKTLSTGGVGGVIGTIAGGAVLGSTYWDVSLYSDGSVIANQNVNRVGGLVGQVDGSADAKAEVQIKGVLNYTFLKSSSSTDTSITTVQGGDYVGGIIGYNGSTITAEGDGASVAYCYNVGGTVIGNYALGHVGGIVGGYSASAPKTYCCFWVKGFENDKLSGAKITSLGTSLTSEWHTVFTSDNVDIGIYQPTSWEDFALVYNEYHGTAIVASTDNAAFTTLLANYYEGSSYYVDNGDGTFTLSQDVAPIYKDDTQTNAIAPAYANDDDDRTGLEKAVWTAKKITYEIDTNSLGERGYYVQGNTQYSTGSAETGYFFAYASDAKAINVTTSDIETIHTSSAGGTGSGFDLEVWKYLAQAVGKMDQASSSSKLIFNPNSTGNGAKNGGTAEAYHIYAKTFAPQVNGYYTYMAAQIAAGLEVNYDGYDGGYYVDADTKTSQNVLVFFRRLTIAAKLTYNGLERYAPLSGLANTVSHTSGAYYYSLNAATAGYNYATDVGTYGVDATVYFVPANGGGVANIVGVIHGDNASTYKWSIVTRKLSCSKKDVSAVYDNTAQSVTVSVTNIVSPDADTVSFTVSPAVDNAIVTLRKVQTSSVSSSNKYTSKDGGYCNGTSVYGIYTFTYTYSRVDAGTYTLRVGNIASDNRAKNNYVVSASNRLATLTITPRTLSASATWIKQDVSETTQTTSISSLSSSASNKVYTYSSYLQGLSSIVIGNFVEDGQTISSIFNVSYTRDKGETVAPTYSIANKALTDFETGGFGTYEVTLTPKATVKNYTGTFRAKWIINKAELSLAMNTLEATTFYYDGKVHKLVDYELSYGEGDTVISGSKYGNDTITSIGSVTMGSTGTSGKICNAGTYTVGIIDGVSALTVIDERSNDVSENYSLDSSGVNNITVTVNPLSLKFVWEETPSYVYTGLSQTTGPVSVRLVADGTTLLTREVLSHTTPSLSGGVVTANYVFDAYCSSVSESETLTITVNGSSECVDAGSYTAQAVSFKVIGNNEGGASIDANYVFDTSSTTSDTFDIAKSNVEVTAVSGTVSKVYDATRSVISVAGISFSIRSLNGGAAGARVNATSGTYDNANVGGGKSVEYTYVLEATDKLNYTISGSTMTASNGTITPRPLTLTLYASNNTVYKSYDQNADYATVYNVSNSSTARSTPFRTGNGMTVQGFALGESSRDVVVNAVYREHTASRRVNNYGALQMYNSYVNNVYYDEASGTYKIGSGYYKELWIYLDGDSAANYTLGVATYSPTQVGATEANPLVIVDSRADDDTANKAGLKIEIRKYTFTADYTNITQSYVQSNNVYTYQTAEGWLEIGVNRNALSSRVSSDLQFVVNNSWRYENGVDMTKGWARITKYTRKTVRTTLTGDNGIALNYTLRNQPILTIDYFVVDNEGYYQISSLAGLMLATYYYANNTVDLEEGNVPQTYTYTYICSEENMTETGSVTYGGQTYASWVACVEALGGDYDDSNPSQIGYYYWAESDAPTTKYSNFKQMIDISATMTAADYLILTQQFGNADGSADWGYGNGFLTSFVLTKAGEQVVSLGSVFADTFAGIYDGNGYTIDGFKIIKNVTSTSATTINVGGMFGYLTDSAEAHVDNVNLRNFTITVFDYSGYANVVNVGGLVGLSAASNTLGNVTVHADITAQALEGTAVTLNVGGIVGAYVGTVAGATVTGTAGATSEYDVNTALENVVSLGKITATALNGRVNAGGIVGAMLDGLQSGRAVFNAVSMNDITAMSITASVGGIIGAIASEAANSEGVLTDMQFASGSYASSKESESVLSAGVAQYVKNALIKRANASLGLTTHNSLVGNVVAGSVANNYYTSGGISYTTLVSGSASGYSGANAKTYDVISETASTGETKYASVLLVNEVAVGAAPRESTRIVDMIDTYVLLYALSTTTVSATESMPVHDVYVKSSSSTIVGTRHGTEASGDSILLAYQSHVALLRMFRFASFTLSKQINMYTGYDERPFAGTFYGSVSNPQVVVASTNGYSAKTLAGKSYATAQEYAAAYAAYYGVTVTLSGNDYVFTPTINVRTGYGTGTAKMFETGSTVPVTCDTLVSD